MTFAIHRDIVSIYVPGGAAIDPQFAMDEPKPLVSGVTVVICTYKRPGSMASFLDSLEEQTLMPQRLIVVDASPDDATERMIRARPAGGKLGGRTLYFRVKGSLSGLTRQRNFGLRCVSTDLTVFYDDDVILRAACLEAMERAFRDGGGVIAGVGGYVERSYSAPNRLWRVRRMLGIVGDLRPGSYQRSGMSVPLSFIPSTAGVVDVDWIPGYAMMWDTAILRRVGFGEMFEGYAQGEDLDCSLQVRRHGRLVIATSATVLHLVDEGGRPNNRKIGYMAIYNRFHIQRRGLDNRTWRDVLWFSYAWVLDSLILARRLFFPGETRAILDQLLGRCAGGIRLLKNR